MCRNLLWVASMCDRGSVCMHASLLTRRGGISASYSISWRHVESALLTSFTEHPVEDIYKKTLNTRTIRLHLLLAIIRSSRGLNWSLAKDLKIEIEKHYFAPVPTRPRAWGPTQSQSALCRNSMCFYCWMSPGVKAKVGSAPFLKVATQFPLILWHPYGRHLYFCVVTEKEQDKWLAVFQDCVRHANDGEIKCKCIFMFLN